LSDENSVLSKNQWTIADRCYLSFIWLRTAWVEKLRWRKRQFQTNEVRTFYGYDHLPLTGEMAFGGIVKILDLQAAFPNHSKYPNILYLVSSALPYFPVRMALLAKQAGAKLIVNQNGVAYPGWHGEGWERANRSMKELLHMADYVVYQSKFCQESADRFLGERKGSQNTILYNPVDTTFFCPESNPSISNDWIILLLAGSHWSFYRVTAALETLQRVRKKNNRVRLRIAGRFCWSAKEQDSHQHVLDYAQRLGVAEFVDITGSYTQLQAPELFNQCSILLHTKYNDPCPRLVVEAMSCGLPIVYSATGGVPELVGGEAGVGIPGPLDWDKDHPPDASDLACAVEQVISELELYSQAARFRAVQKFDTDFWLKRHDKIFQQMLR